MDFLFIPIGLLLLALLLQPLAQRRRERAMMEEMKQLRERLDASTAADIALKSHQTESKLPEKWYDSYRFWLK